MPGWAANRMPKPRHLKAKGSAYSTIAGKGIYFGRWGTPEAETGWKRTGRADRTERCRESAAARTAL